MGLAGAGLNYRGYNINELAEKSTFEEVFYLLIYERMPLKQELTKFSQTIAAKRYIPMALKEILERIPATAHPMDIMRCVASVMGTLEPEDLQSKNLTAEAQNISIRLIAIFGPCLLYWHHYHKNGLRIETYTGPDDSVASNFMKLL